MYDVLVYKMLWDGKKILNINLWRIIRLSMRPATGLCLHISLERILVYTVLVYCSVLVKDIRVEQPMSDHLSTKSRLDPRGGLCCF